MINILLGPSGAGKSYEATVFHALPALKQGRKIITNLPFCLEELGKLDPSYPALIDFRTQNVKLPVTKNSWNPFHRVWDKQEFVSEFIPFASIADYCDPWRHPENGNGPLYIIDECHKALPAKGTRLEVEEWFAEHRHEFADVLLITQSSGKVSKAIMDNLQVVYRCRKAVALGTSKAYIRKVQDGLRGDVVNESIRRYDPKFFPLYKSHTRSDSAGSELAAVDIVPFWKRWPVIGAGICFLGVIVMAVTGKSVNPLNAGISESVASGPVSSSLNSPGALATPSQVSPVSISQKSVDSSVTVMPNTPFAGLSLHITAFLESGSRWMYSFSADQNGQPTFSMKQSYLEQSGYVVDRISPCSARISYGHDSMFVNCNTALVSPVSRGGQGFGT